MVHKKSNCPICNCLVSEGGAARTSHMRMHVRKGEAIEHKRKSALVFLKAGINITDIEPYAKLGNDPLPGQPKGVWELPDIKTEFPALDPSSYFITSGEAVKKADKLVQDAYSLCTNLRTFRDRLKAARGAKKYLETAREGSPVRLVVKAKDPRNKDPEPIE